MYTIGEFSRITSITIKALHLYHDKDLLRPSFIDENTNYRYYSKSNIELAYIISKLKTMKFSLSEIHRALIEVTDESDITDVLLQKKNKLNQEIKTLKNISSAIDVILIKEKEVSKMTKNTELVQYKELTEIDVISLKWKGEYSETGKAMGQVYRSAGRHAAGPAFNLYFDAEYKEVATVESCLPVKKKFKSKLENKLERKSLKGGRFYTLTHVGPYEKIGTSYAKIFEYIKNKGETAKIPNREVYIKGPGMIFKGNPDKYITEIQIPVT